MTTAPPKIVPKSNLNRKAHQLLIGLVCFFFSLANAIAEPKYFILHHTQCPMNTPLNEITSYLRRHNHSYHFIVLPSGTVFTMVVPGGRASHTRDRNTNTIGVCAVGDFRCDRPTSNQLRAIAELYKKHGGSSILLSHREAMELPINGAEPRKDYTTCPGTLKEWLILNHQGLFLKRQISCK